MPLGYKQLQGEGDEVPEEPTAESVGDPEPDDDGDDDEKEDEE